ncbi:MAG TPA: fused MFS/spermidine synthase [Steroidobacter sp.]|uniref:spermidine synthase n=1 Tax=Steroidobacter sp. TaxID=1978227 RepID=UPI002EDB96FC
MRSSWMALLLLLSGFVAAGQAAANDMKLLHSERSLYREVLVYQAGDVRCICFTRYCRIGRQTCQDVKQPERIVMNYPQMMLGALFAKPDPKSILIIGLGGGTIPRALEEVVPDARIDVVEIDPAVVKVARRFFDLGNSSSVNVIEADGRVQVKRALRQQQRYDIVMLDAFDHEYIPEHLLTREFLQEVKGLLTPSGVLAANTFSSSRLYDHESVTYASVFPQFFNLKRENRVIIAANGALPTDEQLAQNSERFEAAFDSFGFSSRKILDLFSRKQDWKRNARVLTDQYSPANLLNLGRD